MCSHQLLFRWWSSSSLCSVAWPWRSCWSSRTSPPSPSTGAWARRRGCPGGFVDFLHFKSLFQRDVYSNRSFWSNWSQYNISDSHPHYIKFCGLKWKFQICFQQVSAVQGFPEEDSCCHQPLRPWHGHRARQHCLQLRHAWGHRHILAQSGQGWQVGC